MSEVKTQTAMQELKEKLQVVVYDLKDSVSGTDQYGYRSAMESVIKDIDAQMLKKEKEQMLASKVDYTLEYLERAIGAGISIGYDRGFDIDKKKEMVQYIIKSMPPAPVVDAGQLEDWKAKYEKCIAVIKKFDPGIIGMYDL